MDTAGRQARRGQRVIEGVKSMHGLRRARILLVALVVALLAAACDGSDASVSPNRPHTCSLTARLVPRCGVLLGVSAQPPTLQRLVALEHLLGRRFDVVYRYHDLDDDLIDEDERAQAAHGAILHLALAARIYGSTENIQYADIAAGRYDDDLIRQAKQVAAFGKPLFITFEQEASSQRKLDVRGSAAEFRAAWRHIHDVFEHEDANNAVWVWVMSGAEQNLERSGSLWPGNDVVDWISWNAYNGAQCSTGQVDSDAYRSFSERLKPFYDWVHETGPSIGIEPSKPMMISEMGSVLYPGDPRADGRVVRADSRRTEGVPADQGDPVVEQHRRPPPGL